MHDQPARFRDRPRRLSLLRSFFLVSLIGGAVLIDAQNAALAQTKEETAFKNSIISKIQRYAANPKTASLGALMGLWRAGGGYESIYQVQDVLIEFSVDANSGKMTPIGFAERTNSGWNGWFRTSCVKCCPGTFYWHKGRAAASPRMDVINLAIAGRKIDPKTCKKTSTPNLIKDTLKRVRTMRLKEILPGKTIHIVAAPQVGRNRPQYKASVTVQWDYTGTGTGQVSLSVKGPGYTQILFQNRPGAKGEFEFLTTRSGKHVFRLAAFAISGPKRPLHRETLSFNLPAIPGIGR